MRMSVVCRIEQNIFFHTDWKLVVVPVILMDIQPNDIKMYFELTRKRYTCVVQHIRYPEND